jgi:hypothetical protein|tara:strand:- start:1994 stop:3274 length:1281 start_codon:yes stop_codon:yes gene_type:complete
MSIKTICDKFHTYYDANIINSLDKNAENFIEEICVNINSKKIKNIPKENSTLIKLIYNKVSKHYPVPKFLGGPNQLNILRSKKYGKTIFIFGETHSRTTDCPNNQGAEKIEDYLPKLILSTPKFLDIYIEAVFPSEKGFYSQICQRFHNMTDQYYKKLQKKCEKYGSNLNAAMRTTELKNSFRKCLNESTRVAEECKLARVHYTDVRSNELLDHYDPVTQFLDDLDLYFIRIEELHRKYEKINCTEKFFHKHKSTLLLLTDYEKSKKFLLQIFDNKKLVKELNKSYLGEKIKDYYLGIVTKIIEQELQYNNYVINRGFTFLSLDTASMEQKMLIFNKMAINLSINLIEIPSSMVDMYTLSRMFKEFKNVDKQPKEARNIILYFGSDHSKLMGNFLKSIGFNTLFKLESNLENCIKVTDTYLDLLYN